MKKKSMITALVLALVFALSFALVSCKNNKDNTVKHKVTLYDGTTVLKVFDVVDGEKLTLGTNGKTINDFTVTVAGKELMGIYATPSLSIKFDFNTEIKADTSIFAGFKGAYVNDTRAFAIIGTGKGSVLYSSNWGASIGEAHTMTKAASTSENKYSITVNLFEDDKFQIGVTAGLGTTQRGFGYLQEPVKNSVEYFENGGQYLGGDSTGRKSDIVVKQDGKYTLTLTTNPADDTTDTANDNPNVNPWDAITWVRDGDTDEDPVALALDYFIKGQDISGWQNMLSPFHQMSVGIFNQKYTKTIFLKATDVIMFLRRSINLETGVIATSGGEKGYPNLDEASQELFTGTAPGNNMTVKASGNYTFTLDLDKPTAEQLSATFTAETLTVDDYYLNGVFGTVNWNANGNASYKLAETTAGSGIFALNGIEFAAGNKFSVQAFTAASDATNWTNLKGTYDHRYALAATTYKAVSATDNTVEIITAATYNITFNAYSRTLGIVRVAPDDIYINGTVADLGLNWNNSWQEKNKFYNESGNDDERVLYLNLTADEVFGLIVTDGGVQAQKVFISYTALISGGASANFTGASGGGTSGNVKCVTAGAYKITYYLKGANTGKFKIETAAEIPGRPLDVYVNGTIADLGLNWNYAFQSKTKLQDGINADELTITLTLAANEQFMFVITDKDVQTQKTTSNYTALISGGASANFEGANSGTAGNVKCTVAGTYVITFYLSGANLYKFSIANG